MRVGAGAAETHATRSCEAGAEKCERSSEDPAYLLLVGGSVSRGWAVGGGLAGQTFGFFSRGPAWPVAVLGPYVDWFPEASGGAHFGIILGPAAVPQVRGTGVGAELWGGYDLWLSSHWSLGLAAHAIATTDFSDSGVGGQLVVSTLLF